MTDKHITGDDVFLMLLKRAGTRELSEQETSLCESATRHINNCVDCRKKYEMAAKLQEDIADGTFMNKVNESMLAEETGMAEDGIEDIDDFADMYDIEDYLADNSSRSPRWLLYESAIVYDLPSRVIDRLRLYAIGKRDVVPLSALGIIKATRSFCLNLKAQISELLLGAAERMLPLPSVSYAASIRSDSLEEDDMPYSVDLTLNNNTFGKIQLNATTKKITFEIENSCITREENDPLSVTIINEDSEPVSWITLKLVQPSAKWEGTGDLSSLPQGNYQYMIF
jgi:hypothetical protein